MGFITTLLTFHYRRLWSPSPQKRQEYPVQNAGKIWPVSGYIATSQPECHEQLRSPHLEAAEQKPIVHTIKCVSQNPTKDPPTYLLVTLYILPSYQKV